ncbi:MAG TPA: DUF4197 domain-containing protein [Bacteroidia bacterium]|nr:DUF4197 domain-containing protein [Bacteroidia bacterium]
MKLSKISMAVFLFSAMTSCAQIKWDQSIKDAQNAVSGKNLSNDDIIKGLKEALSVGSKNSATKASKMDGYYKNPLIKIPFPKEAQQMESTLKSIGMSKQVDQFVVTLNRAAEDAAKKAAPIFVNAITKMTITDGMNILKGKDDAATQFLKNTTSAQLKNEFMPVVKASINKVQVTKYWNPLVTNYNKVPFVTKMNPNLDDYVTQKAIEGLFTLVAQEEAKIRKDPAARVSDILKKVFGSR